MNTGNRIKERRTELNMSLEDVARVLGVNRSTVKRYEDGVIERIPKNTLEMLAVVLKTTPEYLMGWDDAREKAPELDGEILLLAREMQKLPSEKRSELKDIVKAMSEIAKKENKQDLSN